MTDLLILTPSLPKAYVGELFSVRLQGTGGVPPYTWSVTTLPSGFSFNASTQVLSGTPTNAVVGQYTLTFTLTDEDGTEVVKSLSLVVNPASFKRLTSLVLDDALESVVSTFPIEVVDREQFISHFTDTPPIDTQLGDGTYIGDKFKHWAGEILYGDSSVTSPGSPTTSVYSVLTNLLNTQKYFAQPEIYTVDSFDSLEYDTTPRTVLGFDHTSGYLEDDFVRLLPRNLGPSPSNPSTALGYIAIAQKFALPAAFKPTQVKLYGYKDSVALYGGVSLSITRTSDIATFGAVNSQNFGSSSSTIAYGYISPARLTAAASPTWSGTYQLTVPLSYTSPYISPIIGEALDYYLVLKSDFLVSPTPGYVYFAATVDAGVTAEVPGSVVYGIYAHNSSPYDSPVFVISSPANVYSQTGSPQVAALAFQLTGLWSSPVVGVVDLEPTSLYSSPDAERFWVGSTTALAARSAFKLIDGYDRIGNSPSDDPNNFDELIDAYGNTVTILGIYDQDDNEIVPEDGGFVDASGFLAAGGVRLRVAYLPNTRGSYPEVPFKIVSGVRRAFADMEPDAFIRTANKTGSTDASVLSALLSSEPSATVQKIAGISADLSGNVDIVAGSGGISLTKSFGSSELEIDLSATVSVEPLSGSPYTEIPFSSEGNLKLIGGDNIELTAGVNSVRIDADVGVKSVNSVNPDGTGNFTIQAGSDNSFPSQTFIVVTPGTNAISVKSNIPAATTSTAGLMSAELFDKLSALFNGTADVSTAATGSELGGHSHRATGMQVGSSVPGYVTINATTTIADALAALNAALAAQFTTASETPNLSTITTSFANFFTGYISDAISPVNTVSPGFMPGNQTNRLVEGSAGTVFTVNSSVFGDPGNAGTVALQLRRDNVVSPWYTLETLSLTKTYADAVTLVGGSPPNYTSVALQMASAPKRASGSPTTKLSLPTVTYKGLSGALAPVFEVIVRGQPTLADFHQTLGYTSAKLVQNDGSSNYSSNEVTLFRDYLDGIADISVTSADLEIPDSASRRYLSGISHYYPDTYLGLAANVSNLFKLSYVQQPFAMRDEDTDVETAFNYYVSKTASPASSAWIPSPNDKFILGSPYLTSQQVNFLVKSNGRQSKNLGLVFKDPFGNEVVLSPSIGDDSTRRILHSGRLGTSTGSLTTETFVTEKYRLDPRTYGGLDFNSPSPGPFSSFSTVSVGGDVVESGTYGWPSKTLINNIPSLTVWNVASGATSAEDRSGLSFSSPPPSLSAMAAQVCDLGLTHPGFNQTHNYEDNLFVPGPESPFFSPSSFNGANYYSDYNTADSVVFFRLFRSGTAANQGRLRIWGYRRGTPATGFQSYENFSANLSPGDLSASYYNTALISPFTPALNGLTSEIKYVSGTQTTPSGNPGLTGWLDMCTAPGDSEYSLGEDGYGAQDGSPDGGSGYVDIFWRTGSFSTGSTNKQAVVRLGIHEKNIVITKLEMLNQSTDTAWTSGA